MIRKTIITLAVVFIIGTIAALVTTSIYVTRSLSVNIDPIIYYNPQMTTQIFDRNGETIANIFDKEHRLYAPFETIPSRMIEAIVAIEDTAFFEHYGINPDAILRALYKFVRARRVVEGGSTITQQIVKNLLLTSERSLNRKIMEAMLSIRIETELTKEQIIERYLNEISFGHGYYGVRTAALGYFRKELDQLTLKETAILAGLPNAPSSYDPTKHLAMALARANIVIDRMLTLGWIGDEEYRAATMEVPQVYNDTLTKNRAPYAVDAIVAQLKVDFPDIRSGGYKIYSTIDIEVQQAAEGALRRGYEANINRITKGYYDEIGRYSSLKILRTAAKESDDAARLSDEIAKIERYQGSFMVKAAPTRENNFSSVAIDETLLGAKIAQLNGALVTIDQKNGDVLALVGGVDYQKSVFNRAFQARRQLGSSFKPFVYLAAFDLGYSPASQIADISRTYRYGGEDEDAKVWRPTNYENNYVGLMTARDAVVNSRNLATINLISMVGLDQIFDKLSSYLPKPLPYEMTIALGSHSLNLLEFSEYYTVISNYGKRVKTRLATSVVDRFNNVREYDINDTIVTAPEQSYLMINVMQDVVRRGTGRRARTADIEIAGKTGTTNDSRDAWFVGFTPDTQTIIWFGNDDDSAMGQQVTGGGFSAPVFADYYKELTKLRPELKRRFDRPDGVREITLSDKRKEVFTEISRPPREVGDAPTESDGGEILF